MRTRWKTRFFWLPDKPRKNANKDMPTTVTAAERQKPNQLDMNNEVLLLKKLFSLEANKKSRMVTKVGLRAALS